MKSLSFFEPLSTYQSYRVYIHIHRVYTTLSTVCIDGVERFGLIPLEKSRLKSRLHTTGGYTHEEV